MKVSRTIVITALAAALALLVAATVASAAGPSGKTLFRYVGKLDAKTATSVTVTVENGNRPALRSLLEQKKQQTFTTGAKTVFLKWADGAPKKVPSSDLVAGDYVAVNVRGDHDASLEKILGTEAGIVADRGATLVKPDQPLYLFRGKLVSAGGGKVTIEVKGGNHRALRLLLDQTGPQTFTTGTGTLFLAWAQRVPTVIKEGDLEAGDAVIIRVRAKAGSSLADVEAAAASRVAKHEPKAQEASQSSSA